MTFEEAVEYALGRDRENVQGRNMSQKQDASFGERLRSLREAARLTQEELALRAGLTAKAISALERGERKRPYPHTVRSLADALGLSEEDRASLLTAVSRRGGPSAAVSAPTDDRPHRQPGYRYNRTP